ncbi:hypothetical protein CDD82_4440 [Ophiocordyceps australis]|uniref:Major facilitator superfamily (MFS) profile domain-containing protein n=1 Tax=Ophiocordyceps australis TaxID=1399860 RepID=A0A2C5Z7V1_9HYPO|nr:hypothetical protein CDD82_4440 [Ophiocordyceps australis]
MADVGIKERLRLPTSYLTLLVAIATLGSMQFGFHLAELNAPQDVLTCRKASVWNHVHMSGFPSCIQMSEAAFATISSIFTLGGLVGALCAGPLTSLHGRLFSMRLTALLYLFGALAESIALTVPVLAAGRLFSGFAAGASTVVVPLYLNEAAPPPQRGLFGFMTQISVNFGILFAQVLGYFLSSQDAGRWRWILATAAFIATAQGAGLLILPESPAWLATHGDAHGARRTLQRLRGKGVDIHQEVASWSADGSPDNDHDEQRSLLTQLDDTEPDAAPPSPLGPAPVHTTPDHLGFIEVVQHSRYQPAIVAVVGIMFAQQLCGINSIIMYSVSLFANLFPVSSALLTILISVVNLVMTTACAPLPDRLGRKTCLLISIVGQGTSSLVLALSIIFGAKMLSAIAVLFFVAFFAVGLGPVPFLMAPELVGQEAVGATQSWCLAANYIATFLVAQFFPLVNTAMNRVLGGHGWVYFVFAALALASAVFVWLWVPETRGKKDVDQVWGRVQA